jgi:hypothetical protein
LKDSFNRLRPLFDLKSFDKEYSFLFDFSGWVEAFDPLTQRLTIGILINGNKKFYWIDYNEILNLGEELNNIKPANVLNGCLFNPCL